MSVVSTPRDLVVLVADKDMEETVKGLLSRPKSLTMREIDYEVFRHPYRDAGCRSQCHEFLRSFHKQFQHGLVMFDLEGCGWETKTAEEIERAIEERLSKNGWDDRAGTVVLDPELEIWIWSNSSEVDRVCGWSGQIPSLRQWLEDEEMLQPQELKPKRPKEAFRSALRAVRKQPSSALFRQLAAQVGLRNCEDRSFRKMTRLLRDWFPLKGSPDSN